MADSSFQSNDAEVFSADTTQFGSTSLETDSPDAPDSSNEKPDPVTSFAKDLGFEDVKSAEDFDRIANELAVTGLHQLSQQRGHQQPNPPQPKPQQFPAVDDFDDPDDEDDDDETPTPKGKKRAPSRAEKRLAALEQQFIQYREAQQKRVSEQTQAYQAELRRRANHALDSLQSPKYGVGRNRTYDQIQNTLRLGELSQSILASGKVDSIEKAVKIAAYLDKGLPEGGVQESTNGANVPDLEPRSAGHNAPRSTSARPSPANAPWDPMGILNDPDFRAAQQELSSRR